MAKLGELQGLNGVRIYERKSFKDHRGEYFELWSTKRGSKPRTHFVEDDISVSHKNVLRGIHGDWITGKLITCLYGEIFVAVVDHRKFSGQWHKWETFIISDKNHMQIYIPPHFGLGILALTEPAIFHYKQTKHYDRARQFTIPWNSLGIPWPCKNPILSERDKIKSYQDPPNKL